MAEPRPEEFGAVKGVKPEDFGAVKLARRKEDIEEEKPGLGGRLLESGIKGFARGGPLAGLINTSFELGRTVDKAVVEGAYDVGGAATDLSMKVGASPEIAAGIGYGANVATQAIPALIGSKVGSVAMAPAMESLAKRSMSSALKAPLSELPHGKAAKEIQTLLDEGIAVTPGGVIKLRHKIDVLNKEIKDSISKSTAVVDQLKVWPAIKETLDKFRKQVNPEADLTKIRGAWQEFLRHPSAKNLGFSVQEAQEIKQGTYRLIGDKYGELGAAGVEAQKGLARGLKDEVAAAIPGISKLNEKEGKLLDALDPLERQVFMELRRNPIGMAWLAHSPASWAAYVSEKSSAFKSLLAQVLYHGKERIPEAAVGGAMALTNRERTNQ